MVICALNESQARRRFWNANCPRTSSHHLSVDSSFIHAFEELATEHCRLHSSCNDFNSLFAAPNAINGYSLVPSNLAAKQTETRTFSCPVDFIGTSLAPVALTVVSENIAFQTAVSSTATIFEGKNYIDVVIDVYALQRILADLLNMKDLSAQFLFFSVTRIHDASEIFHTTLCLQ